MLDVTPQTTTLYARSNLKTQISSNAILRICDYNAEIRKVHVASLNAK